MTEATDVVKAAAAVSDILAHSLQLSAMYQQAVRSEPGSAGHALKDLWLALLDQYTKAALIGDLWDVRRDVAADFSSAESDLFGRCLPRVRSLYGSESFFPHLAETLAKRWGYLATCVHECVWADHVRSVAPPGSAVWRGIRDFVRDRVGDGRPSSHGPQGEDVMVLLRRYAGQILLPAKKTQGELCRQTLDSLQKGDYAGAQQHLSGLLREDLWTWSGGLRTFCTAYPSIRRVVAALGARPEEEVLVHVATQALDSFRSAEEDVRTYPTREGYEVLLPLLEESGHRTRELEKVIRASTRADLRRAVCGVERRPDGVLVTVRLWNAGTATASDVCLDFSRHRAEGSGVPLPVAGTHRVPRTVRRGGDIDRLPYEDVELLLPATVPETFDLIADITYREHDEMKRLPTTLPVSLSGPPPDPPGENPFLALANATYSPGRFKGRERDVAGFADRILSYLGRQHFVIGIPRIGKTWFLHALADKLVGREVVVDGKKRPVYPLYANLSFLTSSQVQPWDALADRIAKGERVNRREVSEGQGGLAAFRDGLADVKGWTDLQRLMDEHQVLVVFLFDELQDFFKNPGTPRGEGLAAAEGHEPGATFFGPGFFNLLRREAEQGRACTVYCGLWEAQHYLSVSSKLSPAVFSTAAEPLYLPPFGREAIAELWQDRWLDFDRLAADELYDLTGGMPSLLPLLLQDAWEAAVRHYRVRRLSRGHVRELFDNNEFANSSIAPVLDAISTVRELVPDPGAEAEERTRRIRLYLSRSRVDGRHPEGWTDLTEIVGFVGSGEEDEVRNLLDGMVRRYWVDLEDGRYRLRSRLLARRLVTTGG
ncbi:MAG: hypothetical protein K6U08_03255 [Firmicutes bacterium]|nr:hypothetical protein [Bacillota bacterium]